MVNLGDLITYAKEKADMAESEFIVQDLWISYANRSIGRLYGKLCNANEDWNLDQLVFTLSLAGDGYNLLDLRTVPHMYKPRWIEKQMLNLSPNPWVQIMRVEPMNKNMAPNQYQNSLVRGPFVNYCLYGDWIEIVPSVYCNGVYRLTYIPAAPVLHDLTDPINQYWLALNGWDEWIALDMAIKALAKEESDTADLKQQKMELEVQLIKEVTSRDGGQPRKILDVRSDTMGFDGGNGWGGFGNGWG